MASAVDRCLWGWLGLLIVPVVLAFGGYLFRSSQNRATQEAAERRAQVEKLEACLNHMSELLIPNEDLPSLYDEPPTRQFEDYGAGADTNDAKEAGFGERLR
jgi:hypothetical protein